MRTSLLLTGCLAFSTDLALISKTFPPWPALAEEELTRLTSGEIQTMSGYQTKERSVTARAGAVNGAVHRAQTPRSLLQPYAKIAV